MLWSGLQTRGHGWVQSYTSVDVEDSTVAVHRFRQWLPRGEIGIVVEPCERGLTGAPPKCHVEEVSGQHLGKPVLAEADDLSGAAELEVALGELEAAVRSGDGGEALRALLVDPTF